MYLVLCYDIVQDRRRSRLHRNLKAILEPVQKSVFEGELDPSRYPELLRLVHRTIDHDTDTVRIYHLCAGCRAITDHIGCAHRVAPFEEDIIL